MSFLLTLLVLALVYVSPSSTHDYKKPLQRANYSESGSAHLQFPIVTTRPSNHVFTHSKTEFSVQNSIPNNFANVKQQIAENIRSAISLDPVVPLKRKHPVIEKLTPRQEEVKAAFAHAWKGYRKYAYGHDHLRPISATYQDWFELSLTLVDSLDTLYIMQMHDEFEEAKKWVKDGLRFDRDKDVNVFEVTIRVLGGLIGAFHVDGSDIFKKKAQEIGDILLNAFESPTGLPYSDINLKSGKAHGPSWNPDSTTSEVSTLQLEFCDLSRITGNPVYETTVMKVSQHLHLLPKKRGLVPMHISPVSGKFQKNSVLTLGARADSYYEYLLKQWIQTGKTQQFLLDDYLLAVEGMRDMLMSKTPSNYTFFGEYETYSRFRPKMDHLVCYLPGTLALGYLHGLPEWHLQIAKELLYTCYLTYTSTATGLAAEITHFYMRDTPADADASGLQKDMYVKRADAHNLLRPETIESLFYLRKITGDKKYEDWGWEIFQSFLRYTKVPNGFTSIGNVLSTENTKPRDMMESFFLGETLKYFYLLFSEGTPFNLEKDWVFNTEAHPIPIRSK